MGLIERDQLLSPISETEPSGANLEYDPAFAELERAAEGKPEQRMGNAVVPAEPPDWASVMQQCLALLKRTHDLRVSVHLAGALLQRSGFLGFSEGLGLLEGLLTHFWATVHPELDHEDGDDPTMRVTALSALCLPPVLLTLRTTPLVRHRVLGTVALRDIQALSGDPPAAGAAPAVSAATVEAAFQEVDLKDLEEVDSAVAQCRASLSAIDALFEQQTGSRGPDFAPLSQVLREVSSVIGPRLEARRAAVQGSAPDAETEPSGADGGEARGARLSGQVRSREDVVRAIDSICAYYARSEPTSPLPLLLERCKRLVSSSFLDIIKDLAPDSVAKVEGLAGKKPE